MLLMFLINQLELKLQIYLANTYIQVTGEGSIGFQVDDVLTN